MRVSLRRPAPATLISLVALGCALGGTSYAAATIGTADLQSNAVTSAKVKNGAIKLVDLGPGSVGRRQAPGPAVTTPKLPRTSRPTSPTTCSPTWPTSPSTPSSPTPA